MCSETEVEENEHGGVVGAISSTDDHIPRKMTIWDKIDSDVSRSAIQFLIQLATEDPTAPIEIWINSPGGAFLETVAIYDILQYIPCPIYTIGIGEIASAATLLLAAGDEGHRSIFPNTRFMMHQLAYKSNGTVTDMELLQREVKQMQDLFANLISRHTHMTIEQIKEIFRTNKDKYLSPNEVLERGFADYIRGCHESSSDNT